MTTVAKAKGNLTNLLVKLGNIRDDQIRGMSRFTGDHLDSTELLLDYIGSEAVRTLYAAIWAAEMDVIKGDDLLRKGGYSASSIRAFESSVCVKSDNHADGKRDQE